MVTWRLLPEGFPGEAWDEALQSLEDHCVFQSSAWAEHKKALGWTALRLMAEEGGAPKAMAQLLMRRYRPGAALLWGRGGPAGDVSLWNQDFWRAAAKAAGTLAYARLCSYRALDLKDAARLAAQGWKRPARSLNRNSTFVWDIEPEPARLLSGLSGNWSHNLRRGGKRCAVRRWDEPRAAELAGVYRAMESFKGLKPQHGEEELASLLRRMRERLILYRADGPDGKPIALRACAVLGDKAWDLLAASTEAGRKSYASYALLWALVEDSRARGARRYDLGGADAENARGVYDFKKGTGARWTEYLGEWDRARPGWLRPAAGAAISLKASKGL